MIQEDNNGAYIHISSGWREGGKDGRERGGERGDGERRDRVRKIGEVGERKKKWAREGQKERSKNELDSWTVKINLSKSFDP